MQDVLNPALGSNQFITKFDEKTKAKKRKLKIKLKHKVIALATVISIASIFLNYYLLKTNYVITCNIKVGEVVQDTAGHFMNKSRCQTINQNWIDAINYDIDQRNKANVTNSISD